VKLSTKKKLGESGPAHRYKQIKLHSNWANRLSTNKQHQHIEKQNDRGRSVKPFEQEEAARKHEHIETRSKDQRADFEQGQRKC
jgi:hypothetical protein